MTAAQAAELGHEVPLEDLVLYLAAPDHVDPIEITDPIATFGTAPLDEPFAAAA